MYMSDDLTIRIVEGPSHKSTSTNNKADSLSTYLSQISTTIIIVVAPSHKFLQVN